jgi:Domain of unknown function (DUF4062)
VAGVTERRYRTAVSTRAERPRPAATRAPVGASVRDHETYEDLSMYSTGARPTLVIDRMSSARRLADDELRAWAETQGVFISSVMSELATERRELATTIEGLGATPVLFEDFGGRDEGAQEAFLSGVARCDVYLGIVADRYGAMTPTGRSATHQEYREAIRLDKRISVWVRDGGANRQGDARDFIDEVRVFHTTGSFTNADDLVPRVRGRLAEIASEDLAPWVKLDVVVFRADRVTDRGSQVRIEATVRDPIVGEALVSLRPDQWRRTGPVAFTDHTTSRQMRVDGVSTTTTARSSQGFVLDLAAETQPTTPSPMRTAVNGLDADDVVEHGLRHRLLGEPLPAQLDRMGFLTPAVSFDPVHGLAPEVAGSVAQLLLVEGLVGQGHATRVSVRLGPGHRGPRRVRVEWQPPAWGNPATPRVIEGNLRGGRPTSA